MCFYLVTGFKFFISKEIKIKIRIEKVFYSVNSSTKPFSKEDRNIINFNIFVAPYDRVSSTWLSIKLKPVLQCSYVEEWKLLNVDIFPAAVALGEEGKTSQV